MRVLTASQSLEVDRRTQQEYHIDGALLMEQAGAKGFAACSSLFDKKSFLVFVSGGGNNGGDALVMAREAAVNGYEHIAVIAVSEKNNSAVAAQLLRVEALNIPVYSLPDDTAGLLASADVIFDGIFGVGLSGPVRPGRVHDFIEELNVLEGPLKIAIDLPSGMHDQFSMGDPVIAADETITFGAMKQMFYFPHTRELCGRITCINPGFPGQLLGEYDDITVITDVSAYRFPDTPATSYKNQKGHTAVFAGSVGYSGAAMLASEAALRSRTGLVTLFVDQAVYPAVSAGASMSLMVKPADLVSSEQLSQSFTSAAAGPGWGRAGRSEQLGELLESSLPLVIDADAIELFVSTHQARGEPVILTPHPGEFARMTGYRIFDEPARVFEVLTEAAHRYHAHIVLKTFMTYVCTPEGKITIIEGMNPALGTAGSGDILTGIIAALLSRCLPPDQAAITGVCIHQQCGKMAAQELPGMISADLLRFISCI